MLDIRVPGMDGVELLTCIRSLLAIIDELLTKLEAATRVPAKVLCRPTTRAELARRSRLVMAEDVEDDSNGERQGLALPLGGEARQAPGSMDVVLIGVSMGGHGHFSRCCPSFRGTLQGLLLWR